MRLQACSGQTTVWIMDSGSVTFDSARMGGKPCVRGTRVTVGTLLGLLAAGHSVDEVLDLYPYLKRVDVLAALEFARDGGAIVFTNDLDFGAILSEVKGRSPSVIQLRTPDVSPRLAGGGLEEWRGVSGLSATGANRGRCRCSTRWGSCAGRR